MGKQWQPYNGMYEQKEKNTLSDTRQKEKLLDVGHTHSKKYVLIMMKRSLRCAQEHITQYLTPH